jgi:hypothetical protein
VVALAGNDGRKQLAALLFEPGRRPDSAALADLAAKGGITVSMQPDPAQGWAELLRDGLTFDIAGLAPAAPAAAPCVRHRYGLPPDHGADGFEAVSLTPGPHLAGAEHLLPVVRVATALLLELAALPGLAAISWLPAHNLLSPEWFGKSARGWLADGPFAAFALTSLAKTGTGGVASEGLRFLIGQEFRLMTEGAAAPASEMAIAIRLLDWLVAHGRVDAPREVVLAGVGAVWLDVLPEGEIVARCR